MQSKYPDFQFDVVNSGLVDVTRAIATAKSVRGDVGRLSVKQRLEVLNEAARKFSISEEELGYAVRMTGMPSSVMRTKSREIGETLREFGDVVRSRYSVTDGEHVIRERGVEIVQVVEKNAR